MTFIAQYGQLTLNANMILTHKYRLRELNDIYEVFMLTTTNNQFAAHY